MKVWKKALSAVLSICLVFSLMIGLDFTNVAAEENGTLQNGALTESTEGWTIGGDLSGDAAIDSSKGYLNIWTNAAGTLTISQTVTNVAAGSYVAGVAVVGSGVKGASEAKDNLVLTVTNDTKETTVTKKMTTDGWDNWDNVISTDAIAADAGDSVTITIGGTLEASEWYALKNVTFERTRGILQNGALTDSYAGWTIGGDIAESVDGNEPAGYWNTTDEAGGFLSIWNNSDEETAFSLSQKIYNMEAGTYTANVAAVGNATSKANKSLKMTVKNLTKDTTVTEDITIDDWNTWTNVISIADIAVSNGDDVEIIFSGTLLKADWYGLKNVEFDSATAVEAPINVKKVPGLSEDFIHGVDISTYMSEIQSGVKYYNENGEEENMFKIFKDGGVNYVRIRVWNCPFRVDTNGNYLYVDDAGTEYTADKVTTTKDENGFNVYTLTESGTTVYREGYGAGNCDIEAAVAMGKIATAYGMKVLIDFHYSDFWADPAKYKVPKAWAGMDIDTKAEALSAYTTDCLTQLKEAGVDVGMVQVGNEINGGMAGEKDWSNITKLLKAGTEAVRALDPNILIAIHYADPHKGGYQLGKAKALAEAEIDYDVFASSFYSFWHGTPENLTSVLKSIADTYKKKVMVAEVSYCSTLEDGDGASNVVNSNTSPLNYSIDAEGQAAAVRDAIAAVAAVGEAGIGTFYWEPAWIPAENYAGAENKDEVLASNIDKWQKYGSGWASKWSGKAGDAYDGGVADDESTHGSQWDNQAMFDFSGKALPSINVYKWVYTGAEGPIRVSTVDTTSYTMNYKDTPALPAAVNVNLNDGNIVENVPVIWDAEQLEELKTADFGEYVIDGKLAEFSYDSKGDTITMAEGACTTTCVVTVTGTNYATNESFEDGSTGWTLTDTSGTGAKVKSDGAGGNAKTGNGYYDAWSKSPIDFTIEQEILKDEKLPEKKYILYAYYQGTNVAEIAEEAGLFAEVTYKNGAVKRYDADFEIPNVWKQFYQAKVNGILINNNVTSVKIGTRMACTGNSNGAWIVIDDINLMAADELTEEEAAYLEPIDKTALNAAIAAAEECIEADYTAESWSNLQTALTSAKEVVKKEDAIQAEANEAAEALDEAVKALVTVKEQARVDLNSKIAETEGLAEADYTAESWKAVADAVTAAKALLEDETASAEAFNAAATAIDEAVKALVTVKEQARVDLNSKIAETEELSEADYTAESWKAVADAVTAAKALLEDETASAEAFNAAATAIDEAVKALVTVKEQARVDLNSKIAKAEGLAEADYTAESWKAVADAITAAKALLEDETASAEAFNAAEATLENAVKGLVKKEVSNPGNGNQGTGGDISVPTEVKVSKISITSTSIKIAAGKKVTLKATATPANAANKNVTWSTSNSKYATVSSKGVVTTKKAGAGKTVTITATAADGSGVQAKVKISIMKNAVTKVSLKAASKSVKAGKKVTVKATVKTNGSKVNKTLAWSSSNTKYATVSKKGVVTTKKAGAGKTVTITAKTTDGTNKKATVKIKITK